MKVIELVIELSTRVDALKRENELLEWKNKRLEEELKELKENNNA